MSDVYAFPAADDQRFAGQRSTVAALRRPGREDGRTLASRAVIDQAIGIIRSRSGVSGEEAFARLTRISQSENVKLHIVAERLVEEAVRRAQARRQ